ncbi:hypothetical protein [Mesorhizobium caraganae]
MIGAVMVLALALDRLVVAQPPGRAHSGKSARLSSGAACLPGNICIS